MQREAAIAAQTGGRQHSIRTTFGTRDGEANNAYGKDRVVSHDGCCVINLRKSRREAV
jgi:hypothetical protein